VVVVAASAGGFDPLSAVLATLHRPFRATVLVVMHLDPHSPSPLPLLLGERSPLPVANARDGEPLVPGRILVAPPDRHLVVTPGSLRLTRDLPVHHVRPAADVLFRSAAEALGPRVIGVVLSGGGRDGAAGLAAIRARGGVTVVQEPADAAVPSMPLEALAAVQADHRLPYAQIGGLLLRLAGAEPSQPRTAAAPRSRRD
jgi:two-component system chemotaxis response regulator CheB